MISDILIFINTIIFSALSLLHVYWAFGGTWAFEHSAPEELMSKFRDPEYKTRTLLATLAVAFGLLIFAVITASNSPVINFGLKPAWVDGGTLAIAAIFLLRAMGDFRLVGFFKKEKNTGFAEADSKVYSPLCLFLGLGSVLIFMGV